MREKCQLCRQAGQEEMKTRVMKLIEDEREKDFPDFRTLHEIVHRLPTSPVTKEE
jgi:hypothetical protein